MSSSPYTRNLSARGTFIRWYNRGSGFRRMMDDTPGDRVYSICRVD